MTNSAPRWELILSPKFFALSSSSFIKPRSVCISPSGLTKYSFIFPLWNIFKITGVSIFLRWGNIGLIRYRILGYMDVIFFKDKKYSLKTLELLTGQIDVDIEKIHENIMIIAQVV